MDLQLAGKTVLITGGSKGIGLACAHAFAAEGARVAITSRDQNNLKAAAEELAAAGHQVLTHAADLRRAEDAAAMADAVMAEFGRVDVLVNSAGAAQRTPAAELTPAAFRAAMDAKYFTYVHAIDAVIKHMARERAGAIVNIVGMGGRVASTTHLAGGAANAALMILTAGLAAAWAGHGIRVNTVNPGPTLTGRVAGRMQAESRQSGRPIDELMKEGIGLIPMGRYGLPQEVADVVVFLSSARASYVNGAQIAMDGAMNGIV